MKCWLQLAQMTAPQCRQWCRRTQVLKRTPHFMHWGVSQSGTHVSWLMKVTCRSCSPSVDISRTFLMSRPLALASPSNWGRPVEVRKPSCKTFSVPSARSIRTRTGSISVWQTTVCTRSSTLKRASTASKVSPFPSERLQASATSFASRRALSSRYLSSGASSPTIIRILRTTSVMRSSTVGRRKRRPSRDTWSRLRSLLAWSRPAAYSLVGAKPAN
mmetsp:Transcript_39109/g.110525  ORF Transcript_39109/g.110525 Transcript_39109/m.110525 type:complete len:217 (-) Transcript_39109:1260-1910(-)